MADSKKTPHVETNDDDPSLEAESTEHLRTIPGSEVVVGTNRTDKTEPRELHHERATDKFRQKESVRPVGIDVLPEP